MLQSIDLIRNKAVLLIIDPIQNLKLVTFALRRTDGGYTSSFGISTVFSSELASIILFLQVPEKAEKTVPYAYLQVSIRQKIFDLLLCSHYVIEVLIRLLILPIKQCI